MKILVTGANGYFGQGIVRSLLDLGIDVVATDYSTDNVDTRAERISGDLFSVNNPYVFLENQMVASPCLERWLCSLFRRARRRFTKTL